MAQPAARFTWPPAQTPRGPGPAATEPAPRTPPIARRARPGLRGAIAAIEDVWLGRSIPTLQERTQAAGWVPDAPGDYCPRCGTSAGPYASDDTGCGWCRERALPWARTVRLGSYRGLLRDLVLEVKFTRWRRLGTELGRMLGQSLGNTLADAGADRRRAVVVPVPMSFRRRMATGIDHTLVIARAASAVAGIPIVRPLFRRHGPTQLDVAPSERARNASRSIRARSRTPVPWREGGWLAILLDDVRTTGATLTAAARALRSTGSPQARTGTDDPPELTLWTAVVAITPQPDARPDQELGRSP